MKGLITKEVINWKLLDNTKPTFWCEHLTTKSKCHLVVSTQHVLPLANLLKKSILKKIQTFMLNLR